MLDITEPLIVGETIIDIHNPGELAKTIPECVPLNLPVGTPYPATKQFPNLIFGMATTYVRLRESVASIGHWCSIKGSRLIVIVSDWNAVSSEDVTNLQSEYRDRGILASFFAPFERSYSTSQSHFMVLTRMVEASTSETQWFGLLDDDTFFPHLAPLSDALSALDHTKDMYVGALAEDFGSVRNFGIMAYGGAGAYLSVHLARKLGALDQAMECIRESPPELGDIILRNCVYRHSKARLTILPGL
jgi:hypothetical protein